MEETIVNRVANSGLITIDLVDFFKGFDQAEVDFKSLLHEEFLLREKPFRAFIKENDWLKYKGKWVAVHSSVDAIIPSWAFMLISSSLTGIASEIFQGSPEAMRKSFIVDQIKQLDVDQYKDERVIIKGCGEIPIPDAAYIAITNKLMPVVKSLMYGEACSAVPVFKRKA